MSSPARNPLGPQSSVLSPTVFLLLPVGNERAALESLLPRLRAFLAEQGWAYQILAVDDGSNDGSNAVLERAQTDAPLEILRHRFPRGMRETLRDGLEWIADHCNDQDLVVILPADRIDELVTLPVMAATLVAGADVVVASARGLETRSRVERTVQLLSAGALRAAFRVPGVRNYGSSFIAMRGRIIKDALQRYGGKLLELAREDRLCPLELLTKLVQCGARCTEVSLPLPTARAPVRIDLIDGFPGYAGLFRGLQRRERPPRVPEVPAALPRWEWAVLGGILLVGLAVRLYAVNRIPEVVFHDECDNLVNVYQIMNGRGPGFFGFDWKPQPAASVYILTLFMKLSSSIVALRLPAALYSLGAIIPFYLLLRRVVAATPALLAAALLAGDIWYLHFSRAGWENVSAALFLAGGAICVRDGIRSGRIRSFAWAGVWSALGAYGYFSGRSVVFAVIATILLALVRPRVTRVRLAAGLLVALTVAAILYAPQLPQIIREWDLFQKRTRAVSILAESPSRSSTVVLLTKSFGRKVRQLFVGHPVTDRYLRLDEGPLPFATAILLGLGLVLSLFRWRDTWVWWVFLLVPFGITQVLTTGDLNGARGVIFVPMLYLFVGLTLHVLWQAATAAARPLGAAVAATALLLAVSSTRAYFDWIQRPRVVDDLQPAIPVGEFEDWQKHVRGWTARTDDFFNVYMWKDLQARRQASTSPGLAPQPAPPTKVP